MQKITVTLKQANELSGLSIRKLYDLIAQQKLKSITVGRRRLILYKSLEQLLIGKVGNEQQAHAGRSGDVQEDRRRCRAA
jgi:excisionase family DNA binding protein